MKKRNLLIEYLLAAVLTAFALTIDSPDLCSGLKALGKAQSTTQNVKQINQCEVSK